MCLCVYARACLCVVYEAHVLREALVWSHLRLRGRFGRGFFIPNPEVATARAVSTLVPETQGQVFSTKRILRAHETELRFSVNKRRKCTACHGAFLVLRFISFLFLSGERRAHFLRFSVGTLVSVCGTKGASWPAGTKAASWSVSGTSVALASRSGLARSGSLPRRLWPRCLLGPRHHFWRHHLGPRAGGGLVGGLD